MDLDLLCNKKKNNNDPAPSRQACRAGKDASQAPRTTTAVGPVVNDETQQHKPKERIADTADSSPFMRLPVEVRSRIYLLATKDHIRPYVPAKRGWWLGESKKAKTAMLRCLCLVSKQVSKEAIAEVLRVKPVVLYGSSHMLQMVREPFFETTIVPFLAHMYLQVNRNELADLLRLEAIRQTCHEASDEYPLGTRNGERNRQELVTALSKLKQLKSCHIFCSEYDMSDTAISTRPMAETLWPAIQEKFADNPLQLSMKNECARELTIHRRQFIGLHGPYPKPMAPLSEGKTYVISF